MGKGIKIMKIGGIRIEVDVSWFFLLGFFVLIIADSSVLQESNLNGGLIFLTALAITLIFFAGLLLHELAHTWVARLRGLEVDNIRLFFLGGVSNIKSEPRTPFEEFIITIVGPLTSALLGGLFLLVNLAVGAQAGVFYWATGYLAFINLIIAAFNMIPAFPLDGGHVLKSVIWAITKDNFKAMRSASLVGQGFGFISLAGGVFIALNGDIFDGILLAFFGWYLISAARRSYLQALGEKYLKNVAVEQVMSRPFAVIQPEAPINQLVFEFFMRGFKVVPVVENGYLLGLVTNNEISKIPKADWVNRRVMDVMKRRGSLEVAQLEDNLEETIKKLLLNGQPAMPVLNAERLFVGLLNPEDVGRYLRMRIQYGDKLPTSQPGGWNYPQPPQNNQPQNPYSGYLNEHGPQG